MLTPCTAAGRVLHSLASLLACPPACLGRVLKTRNGQQSILHSPSCPLHSPHPLCCQRHGRFSLLSPPRSSRATPSASPPSPARHAHARCPKPCWEHRSCRPPSPPTADAHGWSTTVRLSAIRDHQRARAGPLVLPRHSTAAGDGYGCRSHEPAGLSVLPSEAEKTKDFTLKLEESEGVK